LEKRVQTSEDPCPYRSEPAPSYAPDQGALAAEHRKTRHFATLDGMRGIAAIAVVTTHAVPFIGGPHLPSGSLAVDLFFLLSGFVLTHAYGWRLDEGLTLKEFFAIRFSRLSPLYGVGALLGTVLVVLQLATGRWELGPIATSLALLSLWIMLPSPMPNSLDEIFIINGPRWSLFYEDAVNLAMVLSWRFFRSTARLLSATAMIGIGLALTMRHYHSYELGWSSETFLAGFLRVSFSFSAGVLIYRLHSRARKATSLANLIPFVLVPLFALNPKHMSLYGLFCIVVAFPALIILGSRFQPRSTRFCRFLGDVSYPLYVIHVPLLGLAAWILAMNGLPPNAGGSLGGVLLIAALIGVSWILAKTYDPVARAWLRSRLLSAGGVRYNPLSMRN
jgi:peptidoglycan/LPS O-acetylase OafA/YrhL